MREKEHEEKRNELSQGMRKIELIEGRTFGNEYKYIRGKGLVRRKIK